MKTGRTDLARKSVNLALMLFLVVWTMLVGFSICRLYLSGQTPLNPATGFHSDFVRVYALGKVFNEHGGTAVYDRKIYDPAMDQVVYPVKRSRFSYVTYPPNAVLLFSFISRIPLAAAQALWIGAGISIFTAALLLLRRTTSFTSGLLSDLFIVVSSFGSFPFFDMCRLGQTTPYVIAGTALCYYFARVGRPFLAGLVTILAALKPQYSLLWLLPLLATRNWKALGGACAIHALLILVTGLYCGWEIFPAYLKNAADSDPRNLDCLQNIMITMGGLFTVFGNSTLSKGVGFAIFGLGSLSMYLVFRRCYSNGTSCATKSETCLALSVLSAVLTNLYSLWYDGTLVAIVTTLLVSSPLVFSKQTALRSRVVDLLLLFFPIYSWLPMIILVSFVKSPGPTLILSVSAKCICLYLMLIAMFCLLKLLHQERSNGDGIAV